MGIGIIILSLLVLLTAPLIGLILAWLCKDELVQGRKWFVIILFVFGFLFLYSLIFYRNMSILSSLGYMIIVTYVSLYKSKDKNFVKLN